MLLYFSLNGNGVFYFIVVPNHRIVSISVSIACCQVRVVRPL